MKRERPECQDKAVSVEGSIKAAPAELEGAVVVAEVLPAEVEVLVVEEVLSAVVELLAVALTCFTRSRKRKAKKLC